MDNSLEPQSTQEVNEENNTQENEDSLNVVELTTTPSNETVSNENCLVVSKIYKKLESNKFNNCKKINRSISQML